MPALSLVATMLLLLPLAAVALSVHRTLDGQWSKLTANPPLQFIAVGIVAFLFAGLMKIAISAIDVIYPVSLTWLTPAQAQPNSYGFSPS